jgi:hypothetical protein
MTFGEIYPLPVSDADKYRNPVMRWFREHRPGVVSVLEKLGITHFGIAGVTWERIRLVCLMDGHPISSAEALARGMTEHEFEDFDRQIDNDDLTCVIDWQICEYPLELEVDK